MIEGVIADESVQCIKTDVLLSKLLQGAPIQSIKYFKLGGWMRTIQVTEAARCTRIMAGIGIVPHTVYGQGPFFSVQQEVGVHVD